MHGVPWLPAGFTDVFDSTLVRAGDVRLHTVQGGAGRPLLLVGGWPQNWYAWRFVMPRLAEHFRVVAVDPRGVGRSDKPQGGYDLGTVAAELRTLMRALGHDRFLMAGHDIGMWLGYALAADHPEAVERLALIDATVPGLLPGVSIFGPKAQNDLLWHFAFNRQHSVNESLVRGREDIYFGHQFRSKAVQPLPASAISFYVETLARDPEALRASFDYYRATDENIAQNEQRKTRSLAMPVLSVAGAHAVGERMADMLRPVTGRLHNVVFDDCGHYVPEERPDALVEELLRFFQDPRSLS
ncbi:pimeloyl-ACP methyl ester carboxylesterase [Nonomuraea thailandensis]|uniref:Pimeloyl-ACP methyl ester carboxylesterase n=1 Tax=Nonomuraea thailandensis TaxID=1188745 RepID=A0A9X2GKV8_9ACTN|nr:alpha/beta hydrolase [Nonomuraea thailandensis]MCP2357376.1 pimeloyl-ACP methyl ester carboxylesterase [Nonomuraea thailandensis]